MYEQNKGKQIAEKINNEDWYEAELIKSNMEFLAWLEKEVK